MGVVRKLKPACAVEPSGFSVARLAALLSERGYLVRLRSGQPKECGRACGRHCLEKLHHTYILVTGSLDSAVTVGLAIRTLPTPSCWLACHPCIASSARWTLRFSELS